MDQQYEPVEPADPKELGMPLQTYADNGAIVEEYKPKLPENTAGTVIEPVNPGTSFHNSGLQKQFSDLLAAANTLRQEEVCAGERQKENGKQVRELRASSPDRINA